MFLSRFCRLEFVFSLLILLLIGCGGGGGGDTAEIANGGGGVGTGTGGGTGTLAVTGTGGGTGTGTGTGTGGNNPPLGQTGTLVVKQTILNRVVAAEIDSVRISGYASPEEGDEVLEAVSGASIYGPVTLAKAATYTLDNVPIEVQAIRIEYLQDGSVRGVFSQNVTIEPDVPFEIVDPNYTDLAGLFSRIEMTADLGGNTDEFPGETLALIPDLFTAQLTIKGYAAQGGDGIDITHLVALESTNPSLLNFQFDFDSRSTRIVFGGSPGTTTITARFLDLESSLPVEILYPQAPFLTEIRLLQNNAVVPFQVPTQLTAIGTFSDGTIRDITNEVEWSEIIYDGRPPGISFDANTPGLVTGLDTDNNSWVGIYYRAQRFGYIGNVYLRPVGVTDPFSG